MTDEQMDARLRTAGQRWRTADLLDGADLLDPANLLDGVASDPSAAVNGSREPRSRRGSVVAIASAAAVVAALAIGIPLAVRGHVSGTSGQETNAVPVEQTRSPTVRPAPSTDGELLGAVWVVASIVRISGNPTGGSAKAKAATGASLTFSSGSVTLATACGTEAASSTVGARTIEFSGLHTVTDHRCPYIEDAVDGVAATASLLTGTVRWSIAGETLTLSKGDTTLEFDRAAGSRAGG